MPESQGVARLRWVLEIVNGTDFVFMCNDHTAVIAPNLKCYLRSLSASAPGYRGHALAQRSHSEIFNSGAAGYVLTRAALRIDWTNKACSAPRDSKWLQGNPGLVLARCLRAHGVKAGDTRDVHGAHRFHAYGLVRTATGRVDDWYEKMHGDLPFSPPSVVQAGDLCCAEHTVSFHYVEAAEQLSLHQLLAKLPHFQRQTDLERWLDTEWPRKNLGAYSQPVPLELAKDPERAYVTSRALS